MVYPNWECAESDNGQLEGVLNNQGAEAAIKSGQSFSDKNFVGTIVNTLKQKKTFKIFIFGTIDNFKKTWNFFIKSWDFHISDDKFY